MHETKSGGGGRKTALVTGASSGLGRELARLFAADGHDVVLVARRRPELDALASELAAAHGITARVFAEDLTDASVPGRIVADLAARAIDVEFLVNSAGFGALGSFAELPLPRQLEMIQVNVAAVVQLTGLLVPGMIARRSGRILNLGSTAGFQPGPNMTVYYATKAFVNSFTAALGYELRGTGVTATVTCPGATDTEFGQVSGNGRSRLFRAGVLASPAVAAHAYRAMLAGKSMVIPGVRNKLAVQIQRLGPRSAARAVAARLNEV